jgi:uncharacterized protein YuzE
VTVRIGAYRFDRVDYDALGDVLYLRVAEATPEAKTYGTPEGHGVSFDDSGDVIGLTIVNAKWLIERDGKITITVPSLIEATAEELAPALSAT